MSIKGKQNTSHRASYSLMAFLFVDDQGGGAKRHTHFSFAFVAIYISGTFSANGKGTVTGQKSLRCEEQPKNVLVFDEKSSISFKPLIC